MRSAAHGSARSRGALQATVSTNQVLQTDQIHALTLCLDQIHRMRVVLGHLRARCAQNARCWPATVMANMRDCGYSLGFPEPCVTHSVYHDLTSFTQVINLENDCMCVTHGTFAKTRDSHRHLEANACTHQQQGLSSLPMY